MPSRQADDRLKYERYTLRRQDDDTVDVLGWGTYPGGSVLAGQPMKVFLENFDTVEEAQKFYPQATQWSNRFTDPQVNLSHLPGEDDPVAGGMYPDDWTDDNSPQLPGRYKP
jgi:hypothetical protein